MLLKKEKDGMIYNNLGMVYNIGLKLLNKMVSRICGYLMGRETGRMNSPQPSLEVWKSFEGLIGEILIEEWILTVVCLGCVGFIITQSLPTWIRYG